MSMPYIPKWGVASYKLLTALSTKSHPPTWPAAALSATSTNRLKTRTSSVPSAATKRAAAPSPATAKSTSR